MPNFELHKLTNYIILTIIIISSFLWFRWNDLFLAFVIGFIIGTNWITPDLDIDSKPSNHKVWWLYKKISIHRGKTHALFYGFIIPLTYLITIPLIIVGLIIYLMNDNELVIRFTIKIIELLKIYYIHIGALISGIGVANGVHIIQDKMS